jgi:hypothetical protein
VKPSIISPSVLTPTSKAGAISASVVYRIVYNLRHVQTLPPPFLYSAIHSHFSGSTFSMPPPPPLPSMLAFQAPTFDVSLPRVLRMNVYWFTCLVFSCSAFFLSMFGKRIIRERRYGLALRKGTRTHRLSSDYFHRFAVSKAMDSIFRLFQVALVVLLLAHVDTIVVSIDLNFFIPIIVCALLYVFGFIGPSLNF